MKPIKVQSRRRWGNRLQKNKMKGVKKYIRPWGPDQQRHGLWFRTLTDANVPMMAIPEGLDWKGSCVL